MTKGRATGHRRRALGQHFLVDPEITRRTMAFADLDPAVPVLEIGPGRGALTGPLREAGHPVLAVELDPELAERLCARQDPGLRVIHADALRWPFDASGGPLPRVVVANLPYSTGTAILMRLLEDPGRFTRIVVMLQREVVERLVALPGSRAYGALSVLTALRARTQFGFLVPPSAFSPPPEVDSAVVRLDILDPPIVSLDRFRQIRWVVRAAFSQRRKTLKNSLGAACGSGELATAALDRAGIDPRRRAETVSLTEFLALTDQLDAAAPWQARSEAVDDA